jgi:hypothetical protein
MLPPEFRVDTSGLVERRNEHVSVAAAPHGMPGLAREFKADAAERPGQSNRSFRFGRHVRIP